MENPSERGAQWPRFQWREREREAAKRFSRNAGGAIPFDFVEKKKKKGKPVTIHHRESPFFPNDDDSFVRFLISVAVIRFVIFPTESFRVVIVSVIFFLSFFFFHPPVFDFVVYVRSSAKRHLSLLERRSEGFEGRTAVPLRGSFRSLREHLRGLRRS